MSPTSEQNEPNFKNRRFCLRFCLKIKKSSSFLVKTTITLGQNSPNFGAKRAQLQKPAIHSNQSPKIWRINNTESQLICKWEHFFKKKYQENFFNCRMKMAIFWNMLKNTQLWPTTMTKPQPKLDFEASLEESYSCLSCGTLCFKCCPLNLPQWPHKNSGPRREEGRFEWNVHIL